MWPLSTNREESKREGERGACEEPQASRRKKRRGRGSEDCRLTGAELCPASPEPLGHQSLYFLSRLYRLQGNPPGSRRTWAAPPARGTSYMLPKLPKIAAWQSLPCISHLLTLHPDTQSLCKGPSNKAYDASSLKQTNEQTKKQTNEQTNIQTNE